MSKQYGISVITRLAARALGVPQLPEARVRLDRDLPVVMRDGTALLANRWSPAGTPAAPLILIRTPYGRGGVPGLTFGRLLAHQGFQVVIQSCRGTDGSGGGFDQPFKVEKDDGADTIAWLQKQAWYPGSFSTFGGSYFGYTQLALAAAAPDHHRAAVLCVTPLSVREIAWPNGIFSPSVGLLWPAQVSRNPAGGLLQLLTNARLANKVRRAALQAPLRDTYLQATGKRVGFLEEWLDAEDPGDPIWKDLDVTAALDELRGSVLVQAGWYDLFLKSSLQQYTHLRARDIDVRMTVGPWTHAATGLKTLQDFFNEVLLDGPARADGARIRLTDVRGDTEHWLQDWPVETSDTRYYLSPGTLSAQPPVGDMPSTSYVYDPAEPTPNVGGATLDMRGGGGQDNREREKRPDVLTYDSKPMRSACTVRGSAGVHLTLNSDRPATSVFLRLCIVAPDGTSTNLTDVAVPLVDNGTSHWLIKAAFPPTSAALRADERLRLQISGGAFPLLLPHSRTAEDQAKAKQRFTARHTIHHDAATLTVPFATSP